MAVQFSLFDLPLEAWTDNNLVDFLEARLPETDRLEYKAAFTHDLADTLVSFAK